jgi:glucose dehydrogenase
VNENVLFENGGKKLLAHFDRNGIATPSTGTNGKVLVGNAYGPINWAKNGGTGTPVEGSCVDRRSGQGSEVRHLLEEERRGHLPGRHRLQGSAALGVLADHGLFYVPANHICMDYEGVEVKYTAGQPYVGAIVRMFPGPGGTVAGSSPGIR